MDIKQRSIYENYKIDTEIKNSEEQFYFIFNDRNLLLINDKLPVAHNLDELNIKEENIKNKIYLGELYSKDSYIIELNEKIDETNTIKFKELREVYEIDDETYLIAGRAIQLLDWENNHQYCGRCGTKTYESDIERAKVCPKCGFMSFTRISPAIITTIIKEDNVKDENGKPIIENGKPLTENKLLMAKHSYHKTIKYALVAGFMEVGETIEEAVKREVMEEVGIEVKEIEYFGSQSWPFPNSLMIGCISKYKSGDIKVDNYEIIDAKWFKKEEIDFPDSNISISAQMIKNFINNY